MKCLHTETENRAVMFSNGTQHIAKRCKACDKHLGFVPKSEINIASLPWEKTEQQKRIDLGMPVGCRACGGDGENLSGCCKECQKKGLHKKLRHFCKVKKVRVWDLSKEQLFELWGQRSEFRKA